MLFQRKVDRAMEWSRNRSGKHEERSHSCAEGELPSMEELRAQANQEMDLEKGDFLAMLIAGFAVILPAGLIVLLLMCGFMFFL